MIMITAESKTLGTVKVDHLVNRGAWYGETWLIARQAGFECYLFVVEAGCEGDAIDCLVDSKHGHLLKTDDLCEVCEQQERLQPDHRDYDECSCSFAGDCSDRVNLDLVSVLERVKVNYFAKRPTA